MVLCALYCRFVAFHFMCNLKGIILHWACSVAQLGVCNANFACCTVALPVALHTSWLVSCRWLCEGYHLTLRQMLVYCCFVSGCVQDIILHVQGMILHWQCSLCAKCLCAGCSVALSGSGWLTRGKRQLWGDPSPSLNA